MTRRQHTPYRTQPHSPHSLVLLTLAGSLLQLVLILRQQLPVALAVTQAITRASANCAAFTTDIHPTPATPLHPASASYSHQPPHNYSARRALSGSTLAARRAGTALATSATSPTPTPASARFPTSYGCTP